MTSECFAVVDGAEVMRMRGNALALWDDLDPATGCIWFNENFSKSGSLKLARVKVTVEVVEFLEVEERP